MVQKGEPIEIVFDMLKQDYPFEAVGEDERQLPVPMYTNRPRLTHPGFSRTDIFQVPTGVGIPTPEAAPLAKPDMQAQGQTYQIADEKQYERALRRAGRAPDEETRRAAMNEVPRVMTQAVASGQNVFRMPTFYGMPYNEDTHFTTGEPMDLAFRLLKDDDNQSFTDTRTMERYLREREERKKEEELRQYPRPFAEFSYEELHHIRQNPSLYNLESGYSGFSRNELENELDQRDVENSPYFDPEFQDIHTGEPMGLAFRLLKTEGLLSTSVLVR